MGCLIRQWMTFCLTSFLPCRQGPSQGSRVGVGTTTAVGAGDEGGKG